MVLKLTIMQHIIKLTIMKHIINHESNYVNLFPTTNRSSQCQNLLWILYGLTLIVTDFYVCCYIAGESPINSKMRILKTAAKKKSIRLPFQQAWRTMYCVLKLALLSNKKMIPTKKVILVDKRQRNHIYGTPT